MDFAQGRFLARIGFSVAIKAAVVAVTFFAIRYIAGFYQ